MAYYDKELEQVVSTKSLKKLKTATNNKKKQHSYLGRFYWWLDGDTLYEGTAHSELNSEGKLLIKGKDRNLKRGQPPFEEYVSIKKLREEST